MLHKVLHVGLYRGINSFGGVVNYTNIFINNFSSKVFQLSYFSIGKSPNWYRGKYKPTRISFFLNQIYRLFLFTSILFDRKISIVHLHSGLSKNSLLREGLFSLIAKLLNKKTVFFIHGWKDEQFDWNLYSPLGLFLFIFNKQDKIIVLSKEFKTKLILAGVHKEKISVSSTMVECKEYQSTKKVSSSFSLLFCASLFKKKGAQILLEAFDIIQKKRDDVTLDIIGHGQEKSFLETKFADIINNGKVTFHGYVSDGVKKKLFAKTDIFVYPSYYGEGFPTVIIEAMCSGNAIITTPVGGLADAIKDGINGLVLETFPPRVSEVHDKILSLIDDESFLSKSKLVNISESRTKYDAKKICQDFHIIYTDLSN